MRPLVAFVFSKLLGIKDCKYASEVYANRIFCKQSQTYKGQMRDSYALGQLPPTPRPHEHKREAVEKLRKFNEAHALASRGETS